MVAPPVIVRVLCDTVLSGHGHDECERQLFVGDCTGALARADWIPTADAICRPST